MGKIGSTLAGAGKWVGANAAMMAMFSLLGPYIDRLVGGGGEQGGMPEGGEGGMTEADLLEMLSAQGGRSMDVGGPSQMESQLLKQELRNQLAGSSGAAFGSSFTAPPKYMSPELMALMQGYENQIAGLAQPARPGFAQIMAERGYY